MMGTGSSEALAVRFAKEAAWPAQTTSRRSRFWQRSSAAERSKRSSPVALGFGCLDQTERTGDAE